MGKRILVAGSTGYLGQFVIKELKRQGYWIRVLCRNDRKIDPVRRYVDDLFMGEATRPETLKDLCEDIDIVFSSLGITRQKDGLTYMDVDYQANRNILNEALASRVSEFMYVSVLNADKLKHLEIIKAKERFVEELRLSKMNYIIIRPNGFFSDMTEVFKMADKGRIYLFGNGEYRVNPIHGEDLAEACVNHFDRRDTEIDIGGPEILTHNQIAAQAFQVLGKGKKITHLPIWLKKIILRIIRTVTTVKTYGPLEFFMTAMVMDMIAPKYGRHTIKEYFTEIKGT